MPLINDVTLTNLRSIHTDALMDTCVRMVYSSNDEGYGYGQSYSAGATFSCLVSEFEPQTMEVQDQVQRVDVRIHFARGTTLDYRDRLRVTKLHGDTLNSPITYEIVAGPDTTHVGVECLCAKVMDGSES